MEAPLATVTVAVIVVEFTRVTEEKETPEPDAERTGDVRKLVPRRVAATAVFVDTTGWLNQVTVGSAGTIATAAVKVPCSPAPLPGVMVRLRAPMAALLATERTTVSAVEETTVVEWMVTPLPETETTVPVLKFVPTIEAISRVSPGRQVEEVIEVNVGVAPTVRPPDRVAAAPPPAALCVYVTFRVPRVAVEPVVTRMVQDVSEIHVKSTTVGSVPDNETPPSVRKPVPVNVTLTAEVPVGTAAGETDEIVGFGY